MYLSYDWFALGVPYVSHMSHFFKGYMSRFSKGHKKVCHILDLEKFALGVTNLPLCVTFATKLCYLNKKFQKFSLFIQTANLLFCNWVNEFN
jgi:hypothetical protein